MSRRREAHTTGDGVDVGIRHRRVPSGLALIHERVEVPEHRGGSEPCTGEGAHGTAQLAHRACGGDAAAHDVTDDDRDPVIGERERVVPVTADLEVLDRRGDTPSRPRTVDR